MANTTDDNQLSSWHWFLSGVSLLLVLAVAGFSWWIAIRPIAVKRSCADQNSQFYNHIVKAQSITYSFDLVDESLGFNNGLEVHEATADGQLNQEILTKNDYFTCIQNNGLN